MVDNQAKLADVASAIVEYVQEIDGALLDGRFDDAAAVGDRILRTLCPHLAGELPREARFALVMAHYARGLAAREQREYTHAVAAFEKAAGIAASPDLDRDLEIHVLNHFAIACDRMGDLSRASQLYERITDLIHPSRKGKGVFWFAYGTVLERKGDRAEAIKAYTVALEDHYRSVAPDQIEWWVPDAQAGIVRSSLRPSVAESGITLGWWFAGSRDRRLVFWALCLLAIALFELAVLSAWAERFESAKLWMILCGFPIGLLILPAVRKVTVKDVSFEAVTRAGVESALPLRMADGTEIPRQ